MTDAPLGRPRFGTAPAGVTCHPRPAAYAVIRDAAGRVAAIRVDGRGANRYWLPGGGIEPCETPEAAVIREVREELARTIRVTATLGEAVQTFYASDEARWYEMIATFFRAEVDGEPAGPGEHQLHWLDPAQGAEVFFHACHAWAATLA